jgi:ATP-dependent Clp protease ATP-binding subunit ClpA
VEKLKEHFSPEVINRLDSVSLFEPLSNEKLVKIAGLELQRFNERLVNYQTAVTASDKVLEWIVEKQEKNNAGAREIRRALRAQVESLMAEIILSKKIKTKYQLTVKEQTLLID